MEEILLENVLLEDIPKEEATRDVAVYAWPHYFDTPTFRAMVGVALGLVRCLDIDRPEMSAEVNALKGIVLRSAQRLEALRPQWEVPDAPLAIYRLDYILVNATAEALHDLQAALQVLRDLNGR